MTVFPQELQALTLSYFPTEEVPADFHRKPLVNTVASQIIREQPNVSKKDLIAKAVRDNSMVCLSSEFDEEIRGLTSQELSNLLNADKRYSPIKISLWERYFELNPEPRSLYSIDEDPSYGIAVAITRIKKGEGVCFQGCSEENARIIAERISGLSNIHLKAQHIELTQLEILKSQLDPNKVRIDGRVRLTNFEPSVLSVILATIVAMGAMAAICYGWAQLYYTHREAFNIIFIKLWIPPLTVIPVLICYSTIAGPLLMGYGIASLSIRYNQHKENNSAQAIFREFSQVPPKLP